MTRGAEVAPPGDARRRSRARRGGRGGDERVAGAGEVLRGTGARVQARGGDDDARVFLAL